MLLGGAQEKQLSVYYGIIRYSKTDMSVADVSERPLSEKETDMYRMRLLLPLRNVKTTR